MVVDFKTHAEVSIIEVAGLLGVKSRRVTESLRILADVMYVREFETTTTVGDWRAAADKGLIVTAIKTLRESMEHLSIKDAQGVISAYITYKF
jgi:hypothetical protein